VTNLMAARSQMGTSLGFHIIFAAIGVGLPLFMIVAEGLYLKTKNPIYLALAKRWSKAFAITFAVGAVSGTIISFLLGLLWPRFMDYAGGIIGMPFSIEGFFFFLEAIFLGIYLYGWKRLSPLLHWLTAFPIAIAGAGSAISVVAANAWMNSPAGFRIVNGEVVDVDPVAAMFNDAWFQQALHMTLAAYTATAFGIAGVYAWGVLRGRKDAYHLGAMKIALSLGLMFGILQAVSGDISARWVAENQPVKFAALEGHFETGTNVPLSIGGWPNPETRETNWAIHIPGGLSWLAFRDVDAEVVGLNDFPMSDQPDPRPVHIGFQVMVGLGSAMVGVAVLTWLVTWRRKRFDPPRWLLVLVLLLTPAGFIAIEAGWTVTEVGRQPWTIQGVLRTKDAVTQVPNQFAAFGGFTMLYFLLAVTCVWLLLRLARSKPDLEPAEESEAPHAMG